MEDIPVQWQLIWSTTTNTILPIPGPGSFSNEERVQAWECVELLPNSVLAHVWLDEVLVLQSLVNDWGLHEEY